MKKILFFLIFMIGAISVFAQSYAGRVYKSTLDQGTAKLTLTLKFISASTGTLETTATYQGQVVSTNTEDVTYVITGNEIEMDGPGHSKPSRWVIRKDGTLALSMGDDYWVTFNRVDNVSSKPKSRKKRK